MATKHLLPCSCGASIPVDPSQAGQQVTCACGSSQAAPSMRAIRQLPVWEGEAQTRPAQSASWSSTAGMLFGGGAVVLLIGLLIGGLCGLYVLRYRGQLANMAIPERVEAYVRAVDDFTPQEVWTAWQQYEIEGLDEQARAPGQMLRRRKALFSNVAIGGFVLAGIGLAITISSLMLRGES